MTKQEIINCRRRIAPFIHRTPVLSSNLINKKVGAELYFKCENFQKTGAFKMRGAMNAVLMLSQKQKAKGVITHSSGNFAQALSLAAKNIGIKAYIIMPETAPQVKKNAVLEYGGEIFACEPTIKARELLTEKLIQKNGATFIHPYDHPHVITGQGTACAELLEQQEGLDHIITPIGGGGLIAGTALSAHFFGKNCSVYGGEPFEADDAYHSMISGKIEKNETINTIADGLLTNLGKLNFKIMQQYLKAIIRVTEDDIIKSMKLIWERMKIIAEPSSAVAFAAILNEKEKFTGKKIGIILSGGNIELSKLPF